MHDHVEILELAAGAIDFELDPTEQSRLDAALAECPLCRRRVGSMRATESVLRRGADIGTPGRVRDVVVRAALGSGARPLPTFRLAVGLSLALILVPAAVYVGSRMIDTQPSVSPSASVPGLTLAPSTAPTGTPLPTEASAPTETPVPSELVETSPPSGNPSPGADDQLRAGDVAAMVTDGRLVIRTQPGKGADSAIFKTRIYPGQRVLVLEGPVEASGYPWYLVRLGDIEGWVAADGPDGERWLAPVRNGAIAYVRDPGDGSGEAIWSVSPDGTNPAVLLSDPGLVRYYQLSWSPDGRRLAFVGGLAGGVVGNDEIFVMDADGSDLVQLTQNELVDDSPAWSPDGTQIAFRRGASPDAIFVVNADGTGERRAGPGAAVAWSPDGEQLAMAVPDGGLMYLWVQSADGSDRRRVSEIPTDGGPPAWSPDGLRLAFAHAEVDTGKACRVCLVDVASGSTTPLTVEDGRTPAWSIAGPIAFSTTGSLWGAFVIDPDGTGRRRVSGDLPGAIAPRWSPDGRWLLFSTARPGSSTAVVDADGSGLTAVGQEIGLNSWPAWRPLLP